MRKEQTPALDVNTLQRKLDQALLDLDRAEELLRTADESGVMDSQWGVAVDMWVDTRTKRG